MGRDMGPILEEIRQLKEERDSWRRVSERLEREKLNALSRLQIAEEALRHYADLYKNLYTNIQDGELIQDWLKRQGVVAQEALERIQSEQGRTAIDATEPPGPDREF